MQSRSLLSLAIPAALAVSTTVSAQEVRARVAPPARAFAYSTTEDMDRAVIGVSTSTGSARDTLGVLVSSVTAGGPAEKAGIEEGSRIASINGVNLRLSPADIGDWEMSSALSRRLTREMAKVKAGDDVELRVYSGGQARTVKLKTVSYEDLYDQMRRSARERERDRDERPAIGVSLGSGSKRDTLGVLVSWLDDDGPAAKAGLEEGNRIQSINGVDLRVPREDAGDGWTGDSKVRRLQRELEKLKVGDEVNLKVYVGGGRTRDFKVKTVAQTDLKGGRGMTIFRGAAPMAIPRPFEFEFNGDEFRRNLEEGIRMGLEPLRNLEIPRVRIENLPRIRIEGPRVETAPVVRRVITNRIVT